MSSRRQPLIVVLAVLLPILLVVGVWLGGHPEDLPKFARGSTFEANQQTQVVDEALARISSDYYRPISEEPTGEHLDRRRGREPQRPLLPLPDPEGISRIRLAAELHRHRRGRRSGTQGSADRARVRLLPGDARGAEGRRSDRRGQRPQSRRSFRRRCHRADQGAAGHGSRAWDRTAAHLCRTPLAPRGHMRRTTGRMGPRTPCTSRAR